MLNQGLIREIIQKGEYEKITEVMEHNNASGMFTFDQSLLSLYSQGFISEETAITQSDKSSDMAVKVRQLKLGKADSLRDLDTSHLKISDSY
jgi:twitching motility protein PilU